MIQRKQSIFIGFSILTALFLFIFPAITYRVNDYLIEYTSIPFGIHRSSSNAVYLFLFLNSVFFISSIMSLLLFHKRKKQIKVCGISAISALLCALVLIFIPLYNGQNYVRNFNWPFYLLFPAVICFMIAIRHIKKDEELVRSANRIR